MGKSQKKRAMRRHNPMRVPDSHLPKGLASVSSSSSKTEAILPIIQKMESVDSSERKWACVAVSNIIQNDPSTRRLLQGKNVVGALITRLTDSEDEVVVEAAGALRNLCIDGGYEICAEMYNKNILTPLKSFIPKISSSLSQYLNNPTSAPENTQTLVYTFADSVITIMWCLSETSNKALNAINEVNLIPFLMSFIASRDKLPTSTVLSAAQCLYVLTDDNYAAINEVKSDAGYVNHLLSTAKQNEGVKGKLAMSDKAVTLSVLSAGILRNISPLPPLIAAAAIDIDKEVVLPLLQPILTSVSLPNAAAHALELVTKLASEPPSQRPQPKGIPKSDHRSETEIQLDQLESQLRTVQLALEILTGVCATLPDPDLDPGAEEVEEDDGGSINEDVSIGEDDDGGDEDDMAIDGAGNDDPGDKEQASSSILSSLAHPLLPLIQPTQLSFPPFDGPSPHPPITTTLASIHICALECLNNIFLSLATSPSRSIVEDVQSGTHIWNTLWSTLAAVGTKFGPGQERREDMWRVCVGVTWGVGAIWRGRLVPDTEKIDILKQYCGSLTDATTRVKCIGTLECMAQHPSSIAENKLVADYLFSLLPTSSSPSPIETEPLLQVVSALIDIYSDEAVPYDINFRQSGYLQKLVESVEGVRKAVRSINRKKEGGREMKHRGDEIRDNLVAFVKYRRNLKLS